MATWFVPNGEFVDGVGYVYSLLKDNKVVLEAVSLPYVYSYVLINGEAGDKYQEEMMKNLQTFQQFYDSYNSGSYISYSHSRD